ncbi:hypothetical protein BBU64B_F0026 (plasmid) [Borreliella burgdorferi 64b]|nr:hypothetical protein BBU64B_F0026 [Borreliella burgdorferi 64b]
METKNKVYYKLDGYKRLKLKNQESYLFYKKTVNLQSYF